MGSPARPDAKGEAQRIKEALRAEVEGKGVDLRELSARTKRSDGYWSQVFNGRVVFTVEHLFTALLAVGTDPRDFFRRYYGLAGPSSAGRGDSVEEVVLRTLERFGFKPPKEDAMDSRE